LVLSPQAAAGADTTVDPGTEAGQEAAADEVEGEP